MILLTQALTHLVVHFSLSKVIYETVNVGLISTEVYLALIFDSVQLIKEQNELA